MSVFAIVLHTLFSIECTSMGSPSATQQSVRHWAKSSIDSLVAYHNCRSYVSSPSDFCQRCTFLVTLVVLYRHCCQVYRSCSYWYCDASAKMCLCLFAASSKPNVLSVITSLMSVSLFACLEVLRASKSAQSQRSRPFRPNDSSSCSEDVPL